MAISYSTNKTSVAKKTVPSASLPKNKGATQVKAHGVQRVSASKMASAPHVTLGTTHGNHSVAHPINGN